MASTIEAQGAIDERRLAEAFDRLDSDDSGYITVENLREILGDDFPKSEVEEILKECAKDGNVSYMDFLGQWQTQKETKRQDHMAGISNLRFKDGHFIPQDPSSDETDSPDVNANNVVSRLSFIRNKYQEPSSSKNNVSDVTIEPALIKHEGDHVYADV